MIREWGRDWWGRTDKGSELAQGISHMWGRIDGPSQLTVTIWGYVIGSVEVL